MKYREITNYLETKYPISEQCEWDNTGDQVVLEDVDIKNVYVALDCTSEVIKDAIDKNANLIITHHPLIFSPIMKLDNSITPRRLKELVKNNIGLYSMHTNYDKIDMNRKCAEKIGLKDAKPLDEDGLGAIGELASETTLSKLCEELKSKFDIPSVVLFGDENIKVKRVAILPGSGMSGIKPAIVNNADVFITGDVGYHAGSDALENKICVIDPGHYGTLNIYKEEDHYNSKVM